MSPCLQDPSMQEIKNLPLGNDLAVFSNFSIWCYLYEQQDCGVFRVLERPWQARWLRSELKRALPAQPYHVINMLKIEFDTSFSHVHHDESTLLILVHHCILVLVLVPCLSSGQPMERNLSAQTPSSWSGKGKQLFWLNTVEKHWRSAAATQPDRLARSRGV